MSNLNVLASENYVSFLIDMGEDGTLGCHLPRSDLNTFIIAIQEFLKKQKDGEYFPEIEYETETMNIEGMKTNEAIMMNFINKITGKRAQLVLENEVFIELIEKIINVESFSSHIYGPAKIHQSKQWKFFQEKEAI